MRLWLRSAAGYSEFCVIVQEGKDHNVGEEKFLMNYYQEIKKVMICVVSYVNEVK